MQQIETPRKKEKCEYFFIFYTIFKLYNFFSIVFNPAFLTLQYAFSINEDMFRARAFGWAHYTFYKTIPFLPHKYLVWLFGIG